MSIPLSLHSTHQKRFGRERRPNRCLIHQCEDARGNGISIFRRPTDLGHAKRHFRCRVAWPNPRRSVWRTLRERGDRRIPNDLCSKKQRHRPDKQSARHRQIVSAAMGLSFRSPEGSLGSRYASCPRRAARRHSHIHTCHSRSRLRWRPWSTPRQARAHRWLPAD